jgi:hypothetical protein
MVQRPPLLASLLLLLALPGTAVARSWQGITPGQSTQADVVARFGEPSTRGKLEGRTALVYKGDQAIVGTRQAQFLVADDGRVAEVNVFPASQLDREAVLGTFGKDPQKTFTDDFRNVWLYRAIGVLVFFGKDGSVEAIRFQAADKSARPAPAAIEGPAGPAGAPASTPASPGSPPAAAPAGR